MTHAPHHAPPTPPVVSSEDHLGPGPTTEPPQPTPAATLRGRSRSPILRFVLRRVAVGLLTLWVVTFLTFLAVQALPGDVTGAVLGQQATPERVEALRAELNLDAPLVSRYFTWLGGMLTGDFGTSTVAAARGDMSITVWSVIEEPLIRSLILAGITLAILVPCAIALGTLAAVRAGRPTDHAISSASLALSAMPEFLLGALLILVFFTGLDLLPPLSMIPPGASVFADPALLVLPVLTLLGVNVAYTARLVRASTIEVLRQDHVTMARLNGFAETTILRRNVLRNSLGPSIQAVALTAQYLVGGIVIVESVFAYPGIGQTLVKAVSARDIQEIMVISTILAAMYIAINVVADLLVVLAVPRLRTATR